MIYIGAMLLAPLVASSVIAANGVSYNRDIRPILSQHCFACHGFDEGARKVGLRLDRAEFAHAQIEGETDGTSAFKPFDPAASLAWARINAEDPDDRMPPIESHRVLTEEQKTKIRMWIEQGAVYEDHWAFTPPARADLPHGALNPIDALASARLGEAGLRLAAPADPATLFRRVSIDLTGLPPRAEEVAAFVSDTDPAAYDKAVARLLASPHFGERMAMRLLHRGVLEMLPLGDDLVITELTAPASFIGRSLHELQLPRRFQVTVVAVRRNRGGRGALILPAPNEPLEEGDILVVVSPPASATDLLARL